MNAVTTDCAPMVRTAPAWLTPLELTALGAIWGASFLFMRVAAPDFGAAPLVAVRLWLGALVLLPLLWHARRAFPPALWPRLALIGAVNAAIPFTLFAWAAQRAPAGVGAITNSMAVLFVALIAFLFYGEKIGARRAVALVAGFAGVVVLASGKVAGADVGPAVAAGTAAAFLYGIGANLVKRHLAGLPATAVAGADVDSVRHRRLADRAGADACLAVGGGARRALHRHRLRHVLPADRAHRRTARGDHHISRAAVRRRLGVVAARRAADLDDGAGRRADPRRRGAEPEALSTVFYRADRRSAMPFH
jgi:multidrug transporter EmrE-like cation transporter